MFSANFRIQMMLCLWLFYLPFLLFLCKHTPVCTLPLISIWNDCAVMCPWMAHVSGTSMKRHSAPDSKIYQPLSFFTRHFTFTSSIMRWGLVWKSWFIVKELEHDDPVYPVPVHANICAGFLQSRTGIQPLKQAKHEVDHLQHYSHEDIWQ